MRMKWCPRCLIDEVLFTMLGTIFGAFHRISLFRRLELPANQTAGAHQGRIPSMWSVLTWWIHFAAICRGILQAASHGVARAEDEMMTSYWCATCRDLRVSRRRKIATLKRLGNARGLLETSDVAKSINTYVFYINMYVTRCILTPACTKTYYLY